MRLILGVLFGAFAGLFLISGIFVLLSVVLGMAFGIVGIVFELLFDLLCSPPVIIAALAIGGYLLYKRHSIQKS